MKIQVKQYHIVRLIFYAVMHGIQTESAKSLLILLDILTVDNICRLEVLKLSHSWHILGDPGASRGLAGAMQYFWVKVYFMS